MHTNQIQVHVAFNMLFEETSVFKVTFCFTRYPIHLACLLSLFHHLLIVDSPQAVIQPDLLMDHSVAENVYES